MHKFQKNWISMTVQVMWQNDLQRASKPISGGIGVVWDNFKMPIRKICIRAGMGQTYWQ